MRANSEETRTQLESTQKKKETAKHKRKRVIKEMESTIESTATVVLTAIKERCSEKNVIRECDKGVWSRSALPDSSQLPSTLLCVLLTFHDQLNLTLPQTTTTI